MKKIFVFFFLSFAWMTLATKLKQGIGGAALAKPTCLYPGYQWDDSRHTCVKLQLIRNCAPGSIDTGNACISRPQFSECSFGYVYNGVECIESNFKCPPYFIFDGTSCTYQQTVATCIGNSCVL